MTSVSADVFACHSAACRPPTSGGTGGSGGGASRSSGTGKGPSGTPTTPYKMPKYDGSIIRDAHGFPFKDQAAAKKAGLLTDDQKKARDRLKNLAAKPLTKEQNAAAQAKADRAMGIAKKPTLKQVAEERQKAGPMRDVTATQGRAGSTPEQYRNNQMLLIAARKRVRKKLEERRRHSAKEASVKREMYGPKDDNEDYY